MAKVYLQYNLLPPWGKIFHFLEILTSNIEFCTTFELKESNLGVGSSWVGPSIESRPLKNSWKESTHRPNGPRAIPALYQTSMTTFWSFVARLSKSSIVWRPVGRSVSRWNCQLASRRVGQSSCRSWDRSLPPPSSLAPFTVQLSYSERKGKGREIGPVFGSVDRSVTNSLAGALEPTSKTFTVTVMRYIALRLPRILMVIAHYFRDES